jgi:formylglycine-generating enzyme required for sulfatase activity
VDFKSVHGDDQAPPDERPQTTRRIAAFLLDRTPVTVAQFRTSSPQATT